VNPKLFVVPAPLVVVLPNGSYVYVVCTVPDPSASATLLPSASVR
jgi:hypothetical protein